MRGNDLPGFAAPRENLIIEKVELCSSMEDRGGNCFGNTVSIYRTALEREKEDANGRVFHLDLRGSFKIDRDFQTFFSAISEFYYVIIYYVSFITSFMWVLFFPMKESRIQSFSRNGVSKFLKSFIVFDLEYSLWITNRL